MIPAKVLIVDGNAICYAAFYSAGHLKSQDGLGTGIIYGFFSQVQHVCRSQQIAHIVVCWDSRQSLRKKLFPAYKEGRGKKDPELVNCFPQFVALRKEILPRLGFVNNFHFIGFEADDLIASICRFPGPTPEQQYIIMSNDQDLYQLLTPNVCMYKPSKRVLYTHKDFKQEYGIDPIFWGSVKAIAGCTSDAVPGVPTIGEKRAIAYIQLSSIGRHPMIDSPEGRAIVERNKPLVVLPYKGTPKMSLDWKSVPSYSEWVALCEELGFESFLRGSDVWERVFAGIAPTNGLDRIRINNKSRMARQKTIFEQGE